jgi:hypothetical protein
MNPFTDGLTMFQRVAEMNVAFGNERGDPSNIDEQALMMQSKSIGSEFVELMKALGVQVNMQFQPFASGPTNMDDVRDALCDIMVFALGAFHRMGIDAEDDMESVVSAVMSRFCKHEHDLLATRAKYDAAGVAYTVHGEFPRVYLRSEHDQQMPEYPKGKFLKSASYRGPIFAPLPAPVPPADPAPSAPTAPPSGQPAGRRFMGPGAAPMEEMAAQREQVMAQQRAWLDWRVQALERFKEELEACSESQQRALMSGDFTIKHVITRKEG